MTAPRVVPAARPAPARPEPRPALRVVPDPAALRARRLARLATGLVAIAACFGLFGIVGVHVMLAQGQSDVQRLQAKVQEEGERSQQLQLQVAALEAPDRIVSEAQNRLGMVTPTTVVALAPASLADPPPSTIPAPRATSTTVLSSSPTVSSSSSPTSVSTTATAAKQ
jgi:cell division protein FtsL